MLKVAFKKIIIEAYSQIDEKAHIHGVALIPRISRNNNLYTKEELKRFDNVTVPLNWEHDKDKRIGTVTFRYNEELETVYYEGDITDESAAILARNKTLFTSIEADPQDMKEICNGPNDCFHMPHGLRPVALALTETPGVPETTVQVVENYINECRKHMSECSSDEQLEDKYVEKKVGNCNVTDIILNRCDGNGHENLTKTVTSLLERIDFLESLFCPHCGELKKKKL